MYGLTIIITDIDIKIIKAEPNIFTRKINTLYDAKKSQHSADRVMVSFKIPDPQKNTEGINKKAIANCL